MGMPGCSGILVVLSLGDEVSQRRLEPINYVAYFLFRNEGRVRRLKTNKVFDLERVLPI
jgi:hypothetical protein